MDDSPEWTDYLVHCERYMLCVEARDKAEAIMLAEELYSSMVDEYQPDFTLEV